MKQILEERYIAHRLQIGNQILRVNKEPGKYDRNDAGIRYDEVLRLHTKTDSGEHSNVLTDDSSEEYHQPNHGEPMQLQGLIGKVVERGQHQQRTHYLQGEIVEKFGQEVRLAGVPIVGNFFDGDVCFFGICRERNVLR